MSRLLNHYSKGKTVFLCCDIQEKLQSRIANFANCVFVSNRFAQLHKILGPEHSIFIVTEQYPKGVGPTAKGIQIPEGAPVFPKTQNSMLIPEVLKLVDVPEVEQAVLWGNETHVCLLQTAAALITLNKKVVIAADGSGSQLEIDNQTALGIIETWSKKGAFVSTSESIVMQIIKDAKDPKFKAVAQLLKESPPIQ